MMRNKSRMSVDDKGLTVGELTMAIGAIIIAGLIWSTFNKKGEPTQSYLLNRSGQEVSSRLITF